VSARTRAPQEGREKWLWFEVWSLSRTPQTTETSFKLSLMLTRPQSRLEDGQLPLSVATSCLEALKSDGLTVSVQQQVVEAVAEWVTQQQIFGQASQRRSRSKLTTTLSTP
jgi:hypothetical protein